MKKPIEMQASSLSSKYVCCRLAGGKPWFCSRNKIFTDYFDDLGTTSKEEMDFMWFPLSFISVLSFSQTYGFMKSVNMQGRF